MKAGVTHRVPLSRRTAILFSRPIPYQVEGCDLVFPGSDGCRPLSNMTLLEMLRGMDAETTAHGFRSTFRDWVADQTDYPREVSEAASAHAPTNRVEAAYRRTDFFNKRVQLMADWGGYCGEAYPRRRKPKR